MSTCEFMCQNGDIVAYRNARIHPFSAVAKYSLDVFDGLHAYWNAEQQHVFRLA